MSLLDGVRFAVLANRLGGISTWSPERVRRLQQRRLRQLVRYAVEHSPYWREKYRGLNLSRLTLNQLPPTSKEELRENFDQALTDPELRLDWLRHFVQDRANLGQWYHNRYAISHTSGSQGAPLFIVQDRRCLEVLFATMSARGSVLARPTPLEGLRRLIEPARVAVVAAERGFYPSGASFEFMRQINPFVRQQWLSSTEPDLIEKLNAFQPHVLVGYASVLEALTLEHDRLRLPSLRQIDNSSEQLTERARRRLLEAFAVPVVDHYAVGECLWLSDGCPAGGGAHINADWAIVEVVDDDYRPVPAGESGSRVLITNLANRVQPFIRYEVADRIALATEPCVCGSRLPRIAQIEGRSAEIFWVADGPRARFVTGVLFHTAIDAVGNVREWRATQVERNRIELEVEPLSGASERPATIERALRWRLIEAGLPATVRVDIQFAHGLAPDRTTGKFRRMASQIGPPERPAQTANVQPATYRVIEMTFPRSVS